MSGGIYAPINSKAQHPLGIPQAFQFRLTPFGLPFLQDKMTPWPFDESRKSIFSNLYS